MEATHLLAHTEMMRRRLSVLTPLHHTDTSNRTAGFIHQIDISNRLMRLLSSAGEAAEPKKKLNSLSQFKPARTLVRFLRSCVQRLDGERSFKAFAPARTLEA